jgi:ATP-dependent DNA helicase RecQ
MRSRGSGARVSKVIRHVFGLADLRPGQRAVIDAVLAKRHTLAIMPTEAAELRAGAPSLAVSKRRVMLAALKQDGLMRERRAPHTSHDDNC